MEEFVSLDLRSTSFQPGGVLGGDVDSENLEIRLGRKPLVQNLRELYEANNELLPADLRILKDYGFWMITFSVGIVDEKFGGKDRIKHLGLKVKLDKMDPLEIKDVFPSTQFVQKVEGALKASADLMMSGKFEMPLDEELTTGLDTMNASGNAGVEANLVARQSLNVFTPIITAVGEQDSKASWYFTKHEKPIVGMQKVMMTVITPREEFVIGNTFTIKVKVNCVIKTSGLDFFPDKRSSKWIKLKCTFL